MIDLISLQKKVHENWHQIVRFSNKDGDLITFEGVIKSLDISDEKEKEFIKNNLSFAPFLNEVRSGVFEFRKLEKRHLRSPKRNDDLDGEYDENDFKNPAKLLQLKIPFDNGVIPKFNEKRGVFVLKKESKSCGECYKYNRRLKVCEFRHIHRESFFPSCRYVFKTYRNR